MCFNYLYSAGGARKKNILSLFHPLNTELSTKMIAQHIPGVSYRTVWRDISLLVDRGLLFCVNVRSGGNRNLYSLTPKGREHQKMLLSAEGLR